jgi:hypothetical protein
MKKLIIFLALLALIGLSVFLYMQYDQPEPSNQKYITFSINAQEFLFVDEGINTINQVIDLHEQYQVPIEILLTSTVVTIYEEQAPDLLERLKTSDQVAVSYHLRPPTPYYTGFDFLDLGEMESREFHETVLSYEEHAIDLNTGLPTEEPGGYEHLKQLLGYPPKSVGMQSDSEAVGNVVANVFKEKGVTFAIAHGESETPYESEDCLYIKPEYMMNLGEQVNDIYVKPEDVSIRLFQCLDRNPEEVIVDGFTYYEGSAPVFMNIKMHDNDFFSEKSAWTQVYLGKNGQHFGEEDFDYMDFKDESLLLSKEEQAAFWEMYENAVAYISESSEYTAIGPFSTEALLGSQQ